MRRRTLGLLGAGAAVLCAADALAADPEVPLRLQVSLLDRVIPFDRNFAVRVHDKLSVVVVVDTSSTDSTRIGAELLRELAALETLGNYPFAVSRVAFAGGQELKDECKRLRAGVVYVTPGMREAVVRLATALQGLRVLTVGAVPEQVTEGLVLGSAQRSGRPRVLVNLSQAKLQEIDFRADFLRMAEVIR